MLGAQEVINCLYGIESLKGYFDKNSGPVAHGSVPKSRQFQRFQFTTILGFQGDEPCGRIHIQGKVKAATQIVACSTD